MKFNKKAIAAALVAGLAYGSNSMADTQVVTGAAAQSGGAGAAVDLDFVIDIPEFISFRVGAAASKSTITFSPTVNEVRTAAADVAGTGGDVGGGAVTVELQGNTGSVTITETTTGTTGLVNGANTISWAQIDTTAGGTIPAPTLSNNSSNTSNVAAVNGVVDASDTWTFDYDNPATIPAAGNYTGTVTYTAAIP